MQIAAALQEAMQDGHLATGQRLPAVRALAMQLHCNPSTVVRAYELLAAQGLLESKPGSGFYVRGVSASVPGTAGHVAVRQGDINFASGTETAMFPVDAFQAALDEVLQRDRGAAFAYQDALGYAPLRESLCSLAERFHVHCTPAQVQVLSGAQQGIDVVAKALLQPGDHVVTEDPTYGGALRCSAPRARRSPACP